MLMTLKNPYVFLPILFAYSVGVAVFLPTPVEVALLPFLAEPALFGVAAVTVGAGKAAGSWMVFRFGERMDKILEEKKARHSILRRFTDLVTRFVAKTKYVGLYLLLTLPLMSDTVPIYVYSLFNQGGVLLDARYFMFTNFLAGVNRALIVLIVLVALGINLVS